MRAIDGAVKAPCHIDVIDKDVCLEIDGKVVLDKGVYRGEREARAACEKGLG